MRGGWDDLPALRHFPKGTVSQFTAARLPAYFERGKPSLKTYNNRPGPDLHVLPIRV